MKKTSVLLKRADMLIFANSDLSNTSIIYTLIVGMAYTI